MKSVIKKFNLMIILLLIVISSGYSVTLSSNQDTNIQDFNSKDNGNSFVNIFSGVEINEFIINNNTYYYNDRLEFQAVNEEFYVKVNNYEVDTNITFMFFGSLIENPVLNIQTFKMNEIGDYYFKFTPTTNNEPVTIYTDITSNIGQTVVITKQPMGFNSLMGGFVKSFLDIVYININIWRIVFYSIIFGMLLLFTSILFGGSFYIFKKAKQIREQKGLIGGN